MKTSSLQSLTPECVTHSTRGSATTPQSTQLVTNPLFSSDHSGKCSKTRENCRGDCNVGDPVLLRDPGDKTGGLIHVNTVALSKNNHYN